MPDIPDLTEFTDLDLDEWLSAINAESHRRQVLADAPVMVEQVQRRAAEEIDGIAYGYLTARDGAVDPTDPPEWVDPSEPGGMPYPEGYPTKRDGVIYISQIPNNVWKPGDPDDPQSGRWWEPQDPEADPDEWAPWEEYGVGDERLYEGEWYRCLQGHTSQPDWTPPETPALWEPARQAP